MHRFHRPSALALAAMIALAALAVSPVLARDTVPASRAAAGPTTRPAGAPDTRVGWIDQGGKLPDAPPGLAWISESDAKPSLRRITREIRRIAQEKRFAGLVIYLDEPELGLDQIDELTEAVREVRKAGKKVLFFAEEYDLDSYLLACSGDEILLLPRGQVELTGLGMEEIYLAGTLEKIGVKADFIQIGKYKGAEEPLTRVGPSPEWSENIDGVLDDLYKSAIDRIAAARGLTAAQVEKAFADCWTMSDRQYVERRLVDGLSGRDLVDAAKKVFGDDFEWEDMLDTSTPGPAANNPFALLQMLMQETKPKTKRATIAIVNASGPISSGDSVNSDNAGLFGGSGIGSRTLEDILDDAADDDNIKGIILRIDSPGGSALASEVIWQARRAAGEDKPVWVSVGSMAASGGYYLACAGEKIYVSPDSLVGSIGVVGGKIILGGLYDKIGLAVHRRSRGPLGDMFNSVEPFTPAQLASLHAAFERTYEQFTDRVKTGRGDRIKDIPAVAQGRIFTGRQAVANGLADKLGGIDAAVRDMAAKLGLRPGAYDVVNLPPPMTLPEYIEQLMDHFAMGPAAPPDQAAALQLARTLFGPQRWGAIRATLSGMMLLQREPVLTLMPAVIVVK
jgi:protease-4